MSAWKIGIDEAGRGPLAGPVAIGLVKVPKEFNWKVLPGVTDSKQLTEAKRECIYKEALRLRRAGALDWKVVMPGPRQIDQKGISVVIRQAISIGLKRLENSTIYRTNMYDKNQMHVLLDGSLKAPVEYKNQKTIIKGDQKEKVIGLASIVAKVTRDRYMVRMGAKPPFAPYGFSTHKGYGTKAHRAAIKQYGVSTMHRQTFCKGLCQ